MKVIITGATGMVGEGVLLECLENPEVERVLAVARRSSGHTHAKLRELLVPDFRNLTSVEPELTGYGACFYCAGVSSVGMKEPEYAAVTYDTPLQFAETLVRRTVKVSDTPAIPRAILPAGSAQSRCRRHGLRPRRRCSGHDSPWL
jgi:nucleoside-diphosphate-sugar epimerase